MESRKRPAKSKESSSKKIKLGSNFHKPCVNRTEDKQSRNVNLEGFLTKMNAHIIPAGIEKTRLEIFKSQIVKNGGQIEERFDLGGSISHIIVDDKMEVSRMLRLLHIDVFPKIPVVKSTWLSLCLRKKELVPFEDFQLQNIPTASKQLKVDATQTETQSKEVLLPLNPPIFNEHQLCATTEQTGHISHMPDSNSENSDSEYESSDDAINNKFCESTTSVKIATKLSTCKQIPVSKSSCVHYFK